VRFDGDPERPAPSSVIVDGVALRRGSRVRLHPRAGADVLDLALDGRAGIVADIEQDYEDRVHVAVTLEDDPGRDLGDARMPGHRFFFGLDEVEPLEGDADAPVRAPRILVAGIGNVFLADDGFGVEVAHRLAARPRRPGLEVVDFGIRGLDLAYALQEPWDAVILVDAAPRGQAPGTLSVVEPCLEGDEGQVPDAHGMDPVTVLRLARALGGMPPRVLLVACEPVAMAPAGEQIVMELSEPVRAAVDGAVRLVETLAEEIGRKEAA
jgi:hydrogenase maturation protease